MIFHQFINAEMCRAYVTVYAICQCLHTGISKALDKLVSNLHPQSSTSFRHLIHIVMICNHPSCSMDIFPTYHRSNYATNSSPKSSSISMECSRVGASQKNSWGKRNESMYPLGRSPPQTNKFHLSGTHSPYGMMDLVRVEFPTLASSRAKDTRNDEGDFFVKDNNYVETPQVAICFLLFPIFCWRFFVENISLATN